MVTVYKFHATWCSPCHILSERLAGSDIEKQITNIDIGDPDNADIVHKYRVRTVPTIIYVKDDEEKKRYTGILPVKIYEETLKEIQDAD